MKKRAFFFLFLFIFIALPVQAHHTKEHVLGAPPAPVIAVNPEAASTGANSWLALGPFFVLAGLGAIRWGYRHRRERRMNDTRIKP